MSRRNLQIIVGILSGLVILLLLMPIPVYRARAALCKVCDGGYCPMCPEAGWKWEKSLGVLMWTMILNEVEGGDGDESEGMDRVEFVSPLSEEFEVLTPISVEEEVVDVDWERPDVDEATLEPGM